MTFEDMLEEILGEISDEYDSRGETKLEVGRVLSGRTPISLVADELGLEVPEGAGDTLAGLLLCIKGQIPRAGEVIEYGNYRFYVIEVKGNRITKVRIAGKDD